VCVNKETKTKTDEKKPVNVVIYKDLLFYLRFAFILSSNYITKNILSN